MFMLVSKRGIILVSTRVPSGRRRKAVIEKLWPNLSLLTSTTVSNNRKLSFADSALLLKRHLIGLF